MHINLQKKLEILLNRHQFLTEQLSSLEVMTDINQFRSLSKEQSYLEPIAHCFKEYKAVEQAHQHAKTLLHDPDKAMRDLAEEEFKQAQEQMEKLEKKLEILLLPSDPHDGKNIFVEIRAAAGGEEAAIFAGDLFRMYARYAERMKWTVEVIHESRADRGGYKEIIGRISGQNVYSHLKFESGAHRVQRVPETEAQGRIHTSTCTVAVLPEVDEIESIQINPADLRVDTYRASGAGGQHVNKTDSAIRITHQPTGLVVECQDERSQHKNRAKAMSLLQSRLLQAEQEKQRKAQAQTRRNLVGTGDRSERIRTYNYPQSRITDHRIQLTLYNLSAVMEGDLGELIQILIKEHQADQLAAMGSESVNGRS